MNSLLSAFSGKLRWRLQPLQFQGYMGCASSSPKREHSQCGVEDLQNNKNANHGKNDSLFLQEQASCNSPNSQCPTSVEPSPVGKSSPSYPIASARKSIPPSPWCNWDHVWASETGFAPFQSKVNQDSFLIRTCIDVSDTLRIGVYGVFDGHGESGHEVSQFIAHSFESCLLRQKNDLLSGDYHRAVSLAFKRVSNLLKISHLRTAYSGTTATIAIRISSNKLLIANIGDSRAVLGRSTNPGAKDAVQSVPLSFDHKPDCAAEKLRIQAMGGRVEPLKAPPGVDCGPCRVWLKHSNTPGLAMSRSIGDDVAHSVGVVDDPDILEYDVQENDQFLVLATDGVWEFLTNDEVTKIVSKVVLTDLNQAARKLVRKSQKRWRKNEQVVDDITVIVVRLCMPNQTAEHSPQQLLNNQ